MPRSHSALARRERPERSSFRSSCATTSPGLRLTDRAMLGPCACSMRTSSVAELDCFRKRRPTNRSHCCRRCITSDGARTVRGYGGAGKPRSDRGQARTSGTKACCHRHERRGIVPESVRALLIKWMCEGDTLVRFASSRLITAGNDLDLLPVSLRIGKHLLGGFFSWTEPKPVAKFPSKGPLRIFLPPRK